MQRFIDGGVVDVDLDKIDEVARKYGIDTHIVKKVFGQERVEEKEKTIIKRAGPIGIPMRISPQSQKTPAPIAQEEIPQPRSPASGGIFYKLRAAYQRVRCSNDPDNSAEVFDFNRGILKSDFILPNGKPWGSKMSMFKFRNTISVTLKLIMNGSKCCWSDVLLREIIYRFTANHYYWRWDEAKGEQVSLGNISFEDLEEDKRVVSGP